MAEPDFAIHGAGEVFLRFRKASKLTLEQIAEKIGSTPRQIAKYEANEAYVTEKRLYALAEAYGITPLRLAHECLVFTKPQVKDLPIGKLDEKLDREFAKILKAPKPKKSKVA